MATVMWTLGNVIDKFVISRYFKGPFPQVSFSCFMSLVAAIVVALAGGIDIVPTAVIVTPFVAGVLYQVMMYFYFKSLYVEQVSRVIPLFTFVPVFVLAFAAVALGEFFAPLTYVGIAALVLGALALCYESREVFKLSRAFWLMMIGNIFFAAATVLVKMSLATLPITVTFFWFLLGSFALIVAFLPFGWAALRAVARKRPVALGLITISESIATLGKYSLFIAATLTAISLIYAMAETQMFFVLLFAVIVSLFYPNIMQEKMSKRDIITKVLALIIMFVGAVMIVNA